MNLSAEPLMRVRKLCAGYGRRAVLSNISFDIGPGEIVALLGVNGSGKTTLIRVLTGTHARSLGDVFFDGQSIDAFKPRELAKRVATVPQRETVPFGFSVREVVAMGRLPYSLGLRQTEEDKVAIESAMVSADLSGLADAQITQLSGGEFQRVLLARALAQNGRLLVCDEPMTHLDWRHQFEFGRCLRQLAEAGHGILVSLHDLNLAAALAHRCLVIHHGELVIEGPTEEALSDPGLEEIYGVQIERVRNAEGRISLDPFPFA